MLIHYTTAAEIGYVGSGVMVKGAFMPLSVAVLLMALGCAPATFNGSAGPFIVWVCPPIVENPATREEPKPEERPT